MKITEQQAQDLLWEEDAEGGLTLTDKSDWVHNGGKGETCRVIFCVPNPPNMKGLDEHFAFHVYRSGSDYTDWHYDFFDLDCYEMAMQEVVEHRWMPVDKERW